VNIRIETNAVELSRFMRELFRDQRPEAARRGVRYTALDFQKAQREHQRSVFVVRRPLFVDRAIKITTFPTKAEPVAIIKVDPPGGQARADVLTAHEIGGTKEPGPGHRAKAVPQAAQPSPTQIVPKRLRPKQLGFTRVDKGGGEFQVFRGRLRTFMIRRPDGSGVILQRIGRGRSDVRTLFILEPGGVEIDARLQFHENAVETVDRVAAANMAKAWDEVLRTAR
jgi:hypothetical protein